MWIRLKAPRCSKCNKYVWIWQGYWSLSDVGKPPHDYWHNKCARPLHEIITEHGGELTITEINEYLKMITNV